MYYEFYIDQFFVEQLISGYLLLSAAGILCGIPPVRRRLLFGALLNAACMTGIVICGHPMLYPLAFLAAVSAAFWKRGLRKEWRYNRNISAGLLAVTVCFGGLLGALKALVPFPAWILSVPSLELVRLMSGTVRRKSRKQEILASVTICHRGKSLVLQGLLDTGNQLSEPLSASPVSIVQKKTIEPLLTKAWEEEQGFFLIPYHSLGTEKGWLQGIRIDEMTAATRRGRKTVKKPIVALYDGDISSRHDYQMILHPEHAP